MPSAPHYKHIITHVLHVKRTKFTARKAFIKTKIESDTDQRFWTLTNYSANTKTELIKFHLALVRLTNKQIIQ